jgi:hypothetical protein
LLDLIVRRRCEPIDRPCFDAIDLGLDPRNFLQHLRRELQTRLFCVQRIRAKGRDEHRRPNRQKHALCLHFGPSTSQR